MKYIRIICLVPGGRRQRGSHHRPAQHRARAGWQKWYLDSLPV